MLCLLLATSLLAATPPTPLENHLLDYFIQNVTEDGRILDRESNRQVVSVAATGFGMKVYAVAAQQGQINKAIASYRIKKAFRTTVKQNPYKNRGFFYHFTYLNGSPAYNGEISTIDSAIFYAGARYAAQILGDKEFIDEVELEISKVDIDLVMKDGYIRHGFKWHGKAIEFIDVVWDNYSEGIIIYRLFNIPYIPKETNFNLPLFVYYYPLCFYDEPLMIENLKKAIVYQQEKYTLFGLTSGDTESRGYQAFDIDTISPLAIWTLTTYLKLPKLTNQDAHTYSSPADGYDIDEVCVLSRNRLTQWKSRDMIAIDVGSSYILLWKAKNK